MPSGPTAGLGAPSHRTWWPPDLLLTLAQALYNKTSEALDQMLQSFIIQNPTADEVHLLLSVRAGGGGTGGGTDGAEDGQRRMSQRRQGLNWAQVWSRVTEA